MLSPEIDKTKLRIGPQQGHTQPIADIHTAFAMHQPALDRRIQDTHENPFWRNARYHGGEYLANPALHRHGGDALVHLPLHLARRIFSERTVARNRAELLVGIRRLLAVEHGF